MVQLAVEQLEDQSCDVELSRKSFLGLVSKGGVTKVQFGAAILHLNWPEPISCDHLSSFYKMATNNLQGYVPHLEDHSDLDLDDEESIASLETDDGQEHPPEKILAELVSNNGFTWYLVKWKDCPALRSSWEGLDLFQHHPWMLDNWLIEKQKQAEGKSKPLDIEAFNKAVLDVEVAERQRRTLRRLKRRVNRVLSIIAT